MKATDQRKRAAIHRLPDGAYRVAIAGVAVERIAESLAEAMAIAYQSIGVVSG